MLVCDLSAEIEKFRAELEEHAQVWRGSLDHTIPDYPIRNGDILQKQSERLARKLGMLRPYIDKFGFPSILTMLDHEWDIYDSAVGMEVAVCKGHSIEKITSTASTNPWAIGWDGCSFRVWSFSKQEVANPEQE